MSHAPKHCALEAYAQQLLSPRANAQLERHLAGCSTCREALAGVRAYAQLRAEAQAEAPAEFGSRADPRASTLSWERLEAALAAKPKSASAAPRRRNAGKLIALSWPLMAVAATLAIAWLGKSGMDDPRPSRPHASAPAPAPEAQKVLGWVSLLAGSATLEHDGAQSEITLDTPIQEGDILRTGARTSLHVALPSETGFALAADSELRVARLRVGETGLALARGRVANRVHKLTERERYQIAVADLTASVRGTRFWVARGVERELAKNEASVFVEEGRVDVSRDGRLLSSLTAGQGFPAALFATPGVGTRASVHLMPPPGPESFALLLPPLPAVRAWQIEDVPVFVAGTLAMRLPPGPSELKFEDARGQIRSVRIDLNAPLVALAPADLAELIAPKALPVGYLSPEQISTVVRSAIEPLRRCYERNLRVEPKLESKFALRMRVSAEGRVVRSEVDAKAKLPLDLERCIEMEAHKLAFPKPEGGGPVSFEVPLNLRSR
jgi:hypothetical protein